MKWLMLLAAVPFATAAPVRVVILTGQSDVQYHNWRATTPFVEQVLEAAGRFEVRVVEEPRGITRETLADYDVALVNYNGPRWGASAEGARPDASHARWVKPASARIASDGPSRRSDHAARRPRTPAIDTHAAPITANGSTATPSA